MKHNTREAAKKRGSKNKKEVHRKQTAEENPRRKRPNMNHIDHETNFVEV